MNKIENQHVLYVVMGASGSGKTSMSQYVIYERGLCQAAKKYSTRAMRPNLKGNDGKDITDDVIHLNLDEIEVKCDILYEMNNNKYGVSSKEIINDLYEDNYILIMSDIRAIKALKKKVEASGHIIKVIFLLSKMDSSEEFYNTWNYRINKDFFDGKYIEKSPIDLNNEVKNLIEESISLNNDKSFEISKILTLCQNLTKCLPQSDSYNNRNEKRKLYFRQYINNIGLFDYVILNTGSIDEFHQQIDNIVQFNNDNRNSRISAHKKIKGPVIFVVCASPKSGKGTLMENLNIMGTSEINITPKYANRQASIFDKRDGMIALGEDAYKEKFSALKDEEYIHWGFHNKKTQYAILKEDIVSRLNSGVAQIFVCNFKYIEKISQWKEDTKGFEEIFPRFVYIYLHRVRTEEELKKELLDEEKIDEIKEIHQSYISNINIIDHVIINPDNLTFSEDLHDQMMSIIELYK